jgi:hypothetical protein
MKMTEIDRTSCLKLRTEALDALKVVADKYGLAVSHKGGRFSPENYTLNIDFTVLTGDGPDAIPATFARDAARVGIPTDCYGKTFTSRGKTFKITGIKTRNRKYPVLATSLVDGRSYKFDTWTVSASFRGAA